MQQQQLNLLCQILEALKTRPDSAASSTVDTSTCCECWIDTQPDGTVTGFTRLTRTDIDLATNTVTTSTIGDFTADDLTVPYVVTGTAARCDTGMQAVGLRADGVDYTGSYTPTPAADAIGIESVSITANTLTTIATASGTLTLNPGDTRTWAATETGPGFLLAPLPSITSGSGHVWWTELVAQ